MSKEIQIKPSPDCGFCLQVICLATLSKHKELLPTRCHHLSAPPPHCFVLGLFPIVSMIMFSLLPDWLPHIFRWFRCCYFLRERIQFWSLNKCFLRPLFVLLSHKERISTPYRVTAQYSLEKKISK